MLPINPNANPGQANPGAKQAGVQYERNPGAEHGEHIRNTAAICNTSASHTYGNVLAVMEQYILESFKGFTFKTVTASTTLANRQVRHAPHQLYKKELPMMVLIPRIAFGQGEDRFLANTLINSRFTNTHAFWGDGSLLELAHDKSRGIYVHGHYNRAVMFIDVILTFNTYAEQINCMSWINNMIPVNHNQFVRAPLELYIPNDFCNLIGNVSKVPVKTEDGSVYKYLNYMNSMWYYPITYKLKGGSNSDEFFMYYLSDIDVEFQDPTPGQGIKDGQIHRAYDISFTVRCDFNTIGYFTLNAPNINKQIHIPTEPDDTAIVSLFSDVINLDDFQLPIGWSILGWPIFKLKYGETSISIDSILNQSLKVVIDHHLKLGIPMERFIKIEFRENGQILDNELYYIDWARRELHLLHPNYRRTYRLIVTVSHSYINNLIKDLYNLE